MAEAALEELWAKFRGWDQRARALKADLDRRRLLTLVLTVTGAFLATLAGQGESLSGVGSGQLGEIAGSVGAALKGLPADRLISGASAAAMAVAAMLVQPMLDPSKERQWIRARALAEASKSEAFKFATRTPPYHEADASQKALAKLQELLASGADVPAAQAPARGPGIEAPGYPMAIEDYVRHRIVDQVEGFYLPKATQNERRSAGCALVVQTLSLVAALLGTTGAVGGGGGHEWIAFLGAGSAAIGAFALAKRYQHLAATYRVTADRLTLRLTAWKIARNEPTSVGADQALVQDAEAILAGEHETWMAEFSSDSKAA